LLWGCEDDPDLLHAGIRLTLQDRLFLELLFDTDVPDGRFGSFVAAKLKKPLPASVVHNLDKRSFRVVWQNAQRAVARWTVNTTPVLVTYASGEAPKLMEYPKYLEGFEGRLPVWTHESVRSAGRKMRGQYRMILRKLQDATWEMRGPNEEPIQKEAMNRFKAATSATKGANASDVRPAVKEAAKELELLGIPPISARSFLRAWVAMKQSNGTLSPAALARVFCKGG
jgi:hypothetical protein